MSRLEDVSNFRRALLAIHGVYLNTQLWEDETLVKLPVVVVEVHRA